jgi:LysR family transcriptional regulator, glycine cleavage system transcriptional activator
VPHIVVVLVALDKPLILTFNVKKADSTMRRRLPPLNSLKAFEAAARLESFSQAAEELRVTHGAISRHVQLLEEWLGTSMFRRMNRGVIPTDAGRAYLAEIGAALDRIAVATAHQMEHGRARLLQISASATLTLRWLIPRLSSFQLENAGIEVRLTTSNEPVSAIDPSYDLVIRRGVSAVKGYSSIFFLSEYRIAVCSPKYLAQKPLHRPNDLRQATLLHSASRSTAWREWLAAAGIPDTQPECSLVFEHNYQTLQAALDGLGVAVASSALIADEVASERLAIPFAEPKLPGEGYYAYVAEEKIHDRETAAFCDWLRRTGSAGEEALIATRTAI